MDWIERSEVGIQNYSGIATYMTTFDLGVVKNMAQVRLNGQDLGVVWTAPWHVEITRALKPGKNELEIDVANVWVNRLLADAALPAEERLTRINAIMYSCRQPKPPPSGLLGPVQILWSKDE